MNRDKDTFFSRWSKRKQALAAGDDVPQHAPGHEPPAREATAPGSDLEKAAELEENRLAAEAIDLDTMGYDSDFSPFFKDGVPPLLRQKAMRLLWRSNPILANIDGLCDYDENFGDPALILEKFESAYKVGKGYLTEEIEKPDDASVPDIADDVQESPIKSAEEENITKAEIDNQEIARKEPEAIDERAFDETDETAPFEAAPEPIRPRVSLRQRLDFES